MIFLAPGALGSSPAGLGSCRRLAPWLLAPLVAACGLAPAGADGQPRASRAAGASRLGATAVTVCGDTNRDGTITASDREGRGRWRWRTGGAFCLANVDDDDRDGRADAADEAVNGADDARDLAPVRVVLPASARGARLRLTVRTSSPEAPPVRLFEQAPGGWRVAPSLRPVEALELSLGLEAAGFANGTWDGLVEVLAEVLDPEGRVRERDLARWRVAPFLLLPNTARTRTVYVSTGHPRYENLAFRAGLGEACAQAGAQLVTHTTRSWKEMWMQDTMELGYTQLPGQPPMHVVLGGLRGADSFGPRLLGPGTGFVQVGANRGIADGVDDWADWMGNLEVSPPVPGYPLGRVFYGRNTDTGVGLHPEVVAFLEAQQVQAPFWLDTGFLTIKHVDEIASFLPGPDGRPRLLLADTRRAIALIPREAGPSNSRNQARLDRVLAGGTYPDGSRSRGLRAELGLADDQIVRLPVSYEGGHNVWSNPVNSVWLNGTVVTGHHRVPGAVAADIASQLRAAGARSVSFIDDAPYQDNSGNVHCATNTRRAPLVGDFARWLPRLTAID
ncbi:MAG: protein-arginine deiminase family protein [Candidatus Sericytochromatia bacterium]|nr:protein-arginine deiminase family protein [Candidatus Sericytochromatia bacterium]